MNADNLHLLLGCRPLPRVSAQITRIRTPWSPNDIVAGRGAFTTSRLLLQSDDDDDPPASALAAWPRRVPSGFRYTEPAAEPTDTSSEPEDPIGSKIALWDSEQRRDVSRHSAAMQFEPSDQIHVLGVDLAGRYIAHCLAGCLTIPPVRFLLHKDALYKSWKRRRRIKLYRGDNIISRRRVIPELPWPGTAESADGVIENLVVTVPASQVTRALEPIRHRLDDRSSICLVNSGLGVAEAVIEAYFPNEWTRPSFMLGHLSTILGYVGEFFAVSEVEQGRLFLSLFSEHAIPIKRHPPLERTLRAMHFIRLLTAMPDLRATGHPMCDFLRRKLPTVAFRTIVDPLALMLDCSYEEVYRNPFAMQLMEKLVVELSRVLDRLPECRDSDRFREFVQPSSLGREVHRRLLAQRNTPSKLHGDFSRGLSIDVDFTAGYFFRRAREVEVDVPTLDLVVRSVKAKQLKMSREIERYIPFVGATKEDSGLDKE